MLCAEGSSPRLRGAPPDGPPFKIAARIIPALAGSTSAHAPSTRATWDHPRACGEHPMQKLRTSWETGSSPRLRGALRSRFAFPLAFGIIPALAGSTSRTSSAGRTSRDHPRACGEHMSGCSPPTTQRGSSPRLRGARLHLGRRRRRDGIIPALAGSTRLELGSVERLGDHPRACGEHRTPSCLTWCCPGSSPRLRGALTWNGHLWESKGIIPALAGSTLAEQTVSDCWRDHPRACGEHT